MTSSREADIDRRVNVLSGLAKGQEAERISDLRDFPFVVLLGEPGIGKSTVLAGEATRDGVPMFTVREIMTGTETGPGAPLYLDALDEYRSDGGAEDKVHVLANAIARSGTARWRLSCRSEDWRKAADVAPISRTTGGNAIIVAQLLPLEHEEAARILDVLGEEDPEHFLAQAHSFGAAGFVETPLGLKLLHEAVKEGGSSWPANRFGLFASATRSLSFERSDVRSVAARHSIDQILDAAGETFLVMLASGARAVWRSNKEPPRADDARAHVLRDDVGIEHGLMGDMLDTPLFRGEGEAFEPMHRTVAEYLGARALASAVRGAVRPALPLDRALALITGHDGLPPTELRGLFAWFVAHLASAGDVETARRLMALDPATVMSYGDAAVFKTPERKLLLAGLGRQDPYFKASEIGVTSVGGLAGEDLAADFAAILNDKGDGTHRLMTVFDALTTGRPVKSLRPLLRSVGLDATRPEWQRRRAIEAYLNGANDPASARREIFDTLETEPPSLSREALRAQLAARFAPGALTAADVRSILAAYGSIPSDSTMGRLYSLERRIEKEPMPQLFDQPVSLWLPTSEDQRRDRKVEIGYFLDRALASTIRSTPDLTASTIWRWIAHVRREEWSELKQQTMEALTSWLDGDQGREAALFDEVLAGDRPTEGPWVVSNNFMRIVRRHPSAGVLGHLMGRAHQTTDPAAKERLFAIAVEIAVVTRDEALYWNTYDDVSRNGSAALLERLTTSVIEQWRIDQARRSAEHRRDEEKQRHENVRILKPRLTELSLGQYPQTLDIAAHWYFAREEEGGIRKVIEHTDAATATAIVAGWRHLALEGLGSVGVGEMGTAEAESRRYYIEAAAVAGIDMLLHEGDPSALSRSPIEVAISVLKTSWVVTDQDRRRAIERWAIERLNVDPSEGAEQIVIYWNSALDAGATDLPGISLLQSEQAAVLGTAVDRILEHRPTMNEFALRSGLRAAAGELGKQRLVELTRRALADPEVRDAVLNVWTVVAFVLDPSTDLGLLDGEQGLEKAAAILADDGMRNLISALFAMSGVERLLIQGLTVRAMGARVTPRDEFLRNARVTEPQQMSEAVRNAINGMTGDPRPEAGQLLGALAADPRPVRLAAGPSPCARRTASPAARSTVQAPSRHLGPGCPAPRSSRECGRPQGYRSVGIEAASIRIEDYGDNTVEAVLEGRVAKQGRKTADRERMPGQSSRPPTGPACEISDLCRAARGKARRGYAHRHRHRKRRRQKSPYRSQTAFSPRPLERGCYAASGLCVRSRGGRFWDLSGVLVRQRAISNTYSAGRNGRPLFRSGARRDARERPAGRPKTNDGYRRFRRFRSNRGQRQEAS